ncbi:MAG: MFS transporter [Chloroflexi bacterium]|nr:MFS transporter [Chloroflexota bacterium]
MLTLPAGQLLERRRPILPLFISTLFVYRLGYLAVALMPFIVMQGGSIVFVMLIILFTIPTPVSSVGFNTIFAEIVPERRRAEVLAWRNIILSAVVSVVGFIAGQALDAFTFPLNYQGLYIIGFASSMVSLFILTKLRVPEVPRRPLPAGSKAPGITLPGIKMLLGTNLGYPRIVLNTLIYGIGTWMVSPLLTIFYIRTLGASNSWIGSLSSIINLTGMVGYFLWQRWIPRWGERRILAWTAIASGFYPALVGLSPSLTPILVLGALYGLVTPGLNLAHFNTLLKVCPVDRRPSALALYTTVMNVGAFVSPLVSVALAGFLDIRIVLIIGSVFWVGGGILFLVRSPQPDQPQAAPSVSAP